MNEIAVLLAVILTHNPGEPPELETYIEQVLPMDKCEEYVAGHHYREIVKDQKRNGKSILFAEYSCAWVDRVTKDDINRLAQ